jgi:hypothetical protein
MKKSTLLAIALLAVAALGFFAIVLIRDSKKSDSELLDFAIKDTTSIDKIIISDNQNRVIDLIKKDGVWQGKDGACIPRPQVELLLEAFATIRFKGYISKGSQKSVVNRMSAVNTKVEIFQNGKWSKTWYIGNSTPDHHGQYMLLETTEGKSDLPVVMSLNGFNGIIETRFYADNKKWGCSQIFALQIDQIKTIDVKFEQDPASSFTVSKDGSKYTALQNGKSFPTLDTNMLLRYFMNYQKIHYNFQNFSLNKKQVDSLRKSAPFCRLTVTETNGNVTKLPLHYVGLDNFSITPEGDTLKYDADNLWTFMPNGEPVKCQFFVFNPLILGHIYFPFMDQMGPRVMPKS